MKETQYTRPEERPFTYAERERVTLLFGGLTPCHERLMRAAAQGLGYRAEIIPTPTKADYQTGREYADTGMCNPAYFNIGALINYLRCLVETQGLSRKEVGDQYLFVTAGSCGPCRFGMYEAQYRLALRNSGFDSFRVVTFGQEVGPNRSHGSGLEPIVPFLSAFLYGVLIGDVLNDVKRQLRPYEIIPGRTDRAFDKVVSIMEDCLREMFSRIAVSERWRRSGIWGLAFAGVAQLLTRRHIRALRDCAKMLENEVEVDYTRAKPICKITGEFWAQTSDGDGNFQMFHYLESQGAEVLAEPLTTWADYLVVQQRALVKDGTPGSLQDRLRRQRWMLLLWIAHRMLVHEYKRLRRAFGGIAHPLADQGELRRLGHPHYNSWCRGGEGHLEIAKTIYCHVHHLAHMVLGLKPFGCMPSTQSDGAQAAVAARYPDILYIPIETSGEGDVNAYSRVLMALGEARERSKAEMATCIEKTGRSLEAIREFCAARPCLRRPFQHIPRRDGVVGRAANFVLYVAARMTQDEIPPPHPSARI